MKEEYISPEGVEERVEYVYTLRVTMTGGGKFRSYIDRGGGGGVTTGGIFDTKEKAVEQAATFMAMEAGMILKPKETLESMLNCFMAGKKK